MRLKNNLKKRMTALAIAIIMVGNTGTMVYAQSSNDESGAAYGWEEKVENKETLQTRVFAVSAEPSWKETDYKAVAVNYGTIYLRSFVMTLLNDTKLCRGVTTHSTSFQGYVRARFETLFGEVIAGSDSDRKISYYGTFAETPDNVASGGWSGVAHTYCGTI